MTESITYGGGWTERKLAALQDYLNAYLDVFKNQRDYFTLYYIDAFAGPGLWRRKEQAHSTIPFFDQDTSEYKQGSPMIALGMQEKGFDRFVFVDSDAEYLASLNRRVGENHPDKIDRVKFTQNDANTVICDICEHWDRKHWRAVVFLDPFGMEVKWRTIAAIAETQAMDLWVLFPLGVAVNRMLTKDKGKMHPAWETCLDDLFGTADWRDRFYQPHQSHQSSLFSAETEEERAVKTAPFGEISGYFIERLMSAFPADGVVDKPLLLRNSRNNPMFALCFASGNPIGAKIAVRIAKHIIGAEK